MTKDKIFRKIVFILLMVLVISIVMVQLVQAVETAEPGSNGDPIVAKSYVDTNIAQLQNKNTQLQEEIKALKDQLAAIGSTANNSSSTAGFTTVTVEAGKFLNVGNGTEIVLKSGTAKAIEGQSGKLSDMTSAKELAKGSTVLLNHLILSFRDDGRGITSITKCSLLIRGSYKIEDKASTPANNTNNNQPGKITTATINASSLNVREKPDKNSVVVAKVTKSETVTVISKKSDWYNIKTSKGVTGWVLGQYITIK